MFRGFVAAYFGTCGLYQLPARRFGTHCLIRCVIQPSSLNELARDLKTYLFVGHQRHESISGVTVSRNRAIQVDIYFIYKCIRGLAPSYLAACCQPTSYCAGRSNLQSANLYQLQVPRTRTCYSDQSLLVNGPAVWNSLPVHRTRHWTYLRDKLKTFLFRTAY